MMFEIVSLIFLIVGSICGAGLISGSEIWLFFAKYGEIALPLSVLFAVIFYVSIKKIFYLKIKYSLKSVDDLSKLIFPKFPSLIKYFFYLIYLFYGAVMFAGLKIINPILMWVGGVAAVLVVLLNKKSVSWVNLLLVPLIIIYIVLLSILNINLLGFTEVYKASIFSFIQVVYYASLNFLLVISYILQSNLTSNKHINFVAAFSSLLCLVCILFIALIISNTSSILSPMPLFDFVQRNKNMGLISTLVLIVSIFTTLVGCLYSLSLNKQNGIAVKCVYIMLICLVMIIISLLGLTKVLTYGYNFIGFMGLLIILIIWFIK